METFLFSLLCWLFIIFHLSVCWILLQLCRKLYKTANGAKLCVVSASTILLLPPSIFHVCWLFNICKIELRFQS